MTAPRWGNEPIDGLSTIQLHVGGLFDGRAAGDTPIHLVRRRERRGTPGSLLCGLDQHALPVGFSVGGGCSTPRLGDSDPQTRPCLLCATVAARMMLTADELPISGSVGRDRMEVAVKVALARLKPMADVHGEYIPRSMKVTAA